MHGETMKLVNFRVFIASLTHMILCVALLNSVYLHVRFNFIEQNNVEGFLKTLQQI